MSNGSIRQLLAASMAAFVSGASTACADGVWFDIGADQDCTVYQTGNSASFEHFPAFAFGTGWPTGTLVYADLHATDCDVIPGGCDPSDFVAGWQATFDGGACGCGGQLNGACMLRLAYDPAVVAAYLGNPK